MAVTYPNKLPTLHDQEFSNNRPVSKQAARKLAQAVNMLSQLVIPGQVRSYAVNMVGVRNPESSGQFQYSNSDEITNPVSPLRTIGVDHHFTPDMRDRFVRGANAGTTSGNEAGGASTLNLLHAHATGPVDPPRGSDGEEGDEQLSGQDHTHGVSTDLAADEPLDPAHLKVAMYLKIN